MTLALPPIVAWPAGVMLAALLGSFALARVVGGPRTGRVGRTLISWAVLARAGMWLLPHAVKAAQNGAARGAVNTGTPPRTR